MKPKPLRNSKGPHFPKLAPLKGITVKEISGRCIDTIPVGTEFKVYNIHSDWSVCEGLGITQIWNDEYVLEETNGKERVS